MLVDLVVAGRRRGGRYVGSSISGKKKKKKDNKIRLPIDLYHIFIFIVPFESIYLSPSLPPQGKTTLPETKGQGLGVGEGGRSSFENIFILVY